MEHNPYVKTRVGWGRLFRIAEKKVLVEFDYMYLVELGYDDIDWSSINGNGGVDNVNDDQIDKKAEDCLVEETVDKVFEYARRPANPYSYLYNNPRAINTPQYFAHWTQRWQNHQTYMVLLRAAKVTGYEPVPSALLYRNHKRDGFHGRSVRVGELVFYLIKPEEMTPGLARRYQKFKAMLRDDIKKHIDDYYQEKEKQSVKELFDIRA